jgi:hypothetical protein
MNIKGLTSNSKQESKHPANEYLYNGKMFQDELGLIPPLLRESSAKQNSA